jgi:type IV pilus assembly protein PilM
MNWYSKIKDQFENFWTGRMDSLLHPCSGMVGLDVGNGAVKLMALKKGDDGWRVTAAAWAAVEPAQDQTVREENTVRAIQECFSKAGAAVSRNAVCSLSGPEVSLCRFSFPPLPDGSFDQAVRLEAQQVCGLDLSRSVVDFQLIEEGLTQATEAGRARKGYLVVGLEDAISQKIHLTQEAQVKPIILDINSLAALNCLCQLEESDSSDTFAVLDVGHTHSYLVILGADGIPFVRDLACSSQQILTTVSQLSQKSVADVRKTLAGDKFSDHSVLEMELKNACGKLIADVLETLRFYSLQQNAGKVSRVYLCGGWASVKPFVRLMEQSLSVKAVIFDPSQKIHCSEGTDAEKVLKQYGPAMTVAAGLAMRSVE